jgi:hypothetical protein
LRHGLRRDALDNDLKGNHVLSQSNLKGGENHLKVPIGTHAATGEECPETGVWVRELDPRQTVRFAKGNRFPPYGGAKAVWILVQYA